jgi:hypothetical protein
MPPSRDPGPAEERSDASHELLGLEGLRHVVVGTRLEPHHLVDGVGLRGEHEDRNRAPGTDLAAELESVHPRKHHVEDDEIRVLRVDQRGDFLGGLGRSDSIPLALEGHPHDLT